MAMVWQLKSRPQGQARVGDFSLVERDIPPLNEGDVHVRNHFLSVEPAMRAAMEVVEGYPVRIQLDEPLAGRAVGKVVASRSADFEVGDTVFHYFGWRDEWVGSASEFEKLPVDERIPEEYWLASMGMPGVTAYFGLMECGKPKAGETLFVSAGAGSVGSNVVQIGKALGLRVIASAGGPEKVEVLKRLGADAVIDYRLGELAAQLRAAAPEGIDIYFDNVGGAHLDAALSCARQFARFAICGMIDTYNNEDARQKIAYSYLFQLVAAQITMQGFIVDQFESRIPEFREVMRPWLLEGKVKPLITFSDGLESTPDTWVGLFAGKNTGKALVKLSH